MQHAGPFSENGELEKLYGEIESAVQKAMNGELDSEDESIEF